MKETNERHPAPPPTHIRVTIARICREWADAGQPLPMDELDRLMIAAASQSKRWGYP